MAYKSLIGHKKGDLKDTAWKEKEFLLKPKQFNSVKGNNWVNSEFILLIYRNLHA